MTLDFGQLVEGELEIYDDCSCDGAAIAVLHASERLTGVPKGRRLRNCSTVWTLSGFAFSVSNRFRIEKARSRKISLKPFMRDPIGAYASGSNTQKYLPLRF